MCEFYFNLNEAAIQALITEKLAPFLSVHSNKELMSFVVSQPKEPDRRTGPSIDVWKIVEKHWPDVPLPTKITRYAAVSYGVDLYSFYVVQTAKEEDSTNALIESRPNDAPVIPAVPVAIDSPMTNQPKAKRQKREK
jgi:hypothetical protein